MKIAVAGEILPDQFRADNLSIAFNQTAIGLIGEKAAGQTRHREWIGKPRQQSHENGQHDCRDQMLNHCCIP